MNVDLTDEVVLKILIERGRNAIIEERKMEEQAIADHAEAKLKEKEIMDYVRKYGTDEG